MFPIRACESSMEGALKIFREYLKKRCMRSTPEREAIVREIFASEKHFDVDELFMRLKRKSGVSRASIYRTLPILLEACLITEVNLEDGHMHYESAYGRAHHCHIHCTECRKVVEFHDARLSAFEKEMAANHGFVSDGHKLEISGLCPDCQKKKR